MSTEATTSDSNRGYRSAASKQRFTIVAGVLGAVFFLAQMVLPMVLAFAIMFPMMMRQELKITDLSGAVLWIPWSSLPCSPCRSSGWCSCSRCIASSRDAPARPRASGCFASGCSAPI